MTDKKRIEELERRVKELEAAPHIVIVPQPVIYQQPVYPYYPYNPFWNGQERITCIGNSNLMGQQISSNV